LLEVRDRELLTRPHFVEVGQKIAARPWVIHEHETIQKDCSGMLQQVDGSELEGDELLHDVLRAL
jgi:hypothetical protein